MDFNKTDIPSTKLLFFTNDFLKDLKKEMDHIFPKDAEEKINYWSHYNWLEGTVGFYKALKKTCQKFDCEEEIHDWLKSLEWDEGDIMEDEIIKLMVSRGIIEEGDVGDGIVMQATYMDAELSLHIISEYFESWINRDEELFLSLLDDDIVINECTGASYLNKQIAGKWFKGWHAEGNKVLVWDIKDHFYDEEKEVAIVKWRYICLYLEKEHMFDGASVVKFRKNKIVGLDEYQMEAEKKFPYIK